MKKYLSSLILPFFVCALSVYYTSCSNTTPISNQPLVLVSIPPYKYFLEKIVYNTLAIETIVPIGVDPHTFEPPAQDIQKIAHAKVWFQVGEFFEPKLQKFLEHHNRDLTKCDLRNTIPLLPLKHCTAHAADYYGYDLHIWMDPLLMIPQIEAMVQVLSQIFPEHALLYQSRIRTIIQELQDLDQQIRSILQPLKYRTFLTSHPSFDYFCATYNLTQLSVEADGKDPLPQHITHILSVAREEQIQVALIEPQFNNKGLCILAKQLGIPIVSIDPYSLEYPNNLLLLAKSLHPDSP